MLEELAKKDKLWRAIAYNICKDSMLADDIVQEMYLRFHRNPKAKINDYYVALVIKSVFLNSLKENKPISLSKFHYVEDTSTDFNPDDEQTEMLNEIEKLSWVQKELLAEIYHRSYREIERIYNINYGYVYRKVQEARNQVLNKK